MKRTNTIYLYFIAGIVVCISVLVLFSFQDKHSNDYSELKSNTTEDTSSIEVSKATESILIPLPEKMDFAGEEVPLTNLDVAERLDRELIVNTYWHSQTILFHKRSTRWFPIIEPILKQNNVPDDFKYLALIESGLDNVVSPAGARGFWQFMKTTAKSYNLEVNENVDERYHVEKATEAACKYLKKAKDNFGSWTLAAASYNMGIAGLNKKLKAQQCTNYYDLLLNSETARYIYRILAAKQILTHSELYHFTFEDNELYQPYNYKVVNIDTSITDLNQFAIQQGINYKILKLLNPWLRSNQLPNPTQKTYNIKISTDIHPIESINE